MVCVANEVKVDCTVQDGTESFNFNILPASTTVDELYKRVSEHRNCEPDSFELVHQEINLTRGQDKTLMELSPDSLRSTTSITIKITDIPSKQQEQEHVVLTDENLHGVTDIDFGKKVIKGRNIKLRDYTYSKYDESPSRPEKNYVGLVNQAMTCYLNSLLQALYMTPEFRNALYNWEYVDGSGKDQSSSIPYQLQKLFLNLQTSMKSSVETTSLTKSFGWDFSEAWQQHDIQELCRVMFDALETKFKDTEQADLINRLYEGKMLDYVKCLECKTEKSREDTFLDIPLPVRPFDSTTAYESVEEALKAFVKYETLDGNNQYHCEKCNKKCDAQKGLKFTKFPYILTLHLKRFDFDHKTLIRMKLNDKVTFPHILDLNSFIDTTLNRESPCVEEDAGMSVKFDDTSTTDSGTLEDECPPCDGAMSTNNHSNRDHENDEGIDMSNGISTINGILHNNHETEKNLEKCLKEEGSYVYELFSIMIHNGGASGGHYYAYIKDLTTNKWLCFNDSNVSPINESHIEKVYGGGPSKAYASSTNAYMLMYRQQDPSKNTVPMQEEDFPQHIKTLLQKIKESKDDDKRYDDNCDFSFKVKVFCHHPKTKKLMNKSIRPGTALSLAELKEKAYDKFGLFGDVDLDQCRLVFYNSVNKVITHVYEGNETDSIRDFFKDFNESTNFLLEIRGKNEEFEIYKPNGIALQVYFIDMVKKDIIDGPFNVRGYDLQKVEELKKQLSKIIPIDPQKAIIFVKDKEASKYRKFYDFEALQSRNNDIFSYTLYVTSSSDGISENDYSTNKAHLSVIESFQRIMWLHIQLPNNCKDFAEEFKTLSLEDESKNCVEPKEELVTSSETDLSFLDDVIKNLLQKNPAASVDGSKDEDGVKSICLEKSPIILTNERQWTRKKHEETSAFKSKVGLESASEDSSLSDSEKTLVEESSGVTNNYMDKIYNKQIQSYSEEQSNYYFKALLDSSLGNTNLLKVFVDGRMNVETLKKRLEKYVRVSADNFIICAQNSDSLDKENFAPKDEIHLYNGQRFCIKLGKDLVKGELKLKLYLLKTNCAVEPYKFLFDWYISENMTVAEAKEGLISELKHKQNIEIPLERLRLRKKVYSVSRVLLNHSTFKDMNVSSDDEVIVQELEEDETVTEPEHVALFIRWWSRSTLSLHPCQDIVLTERTIPKLIEKIRSLINIPEDYLEIAKGKGNFPCEHINFLNLDDEYDWKVYSKEEDRCSIKLDNGCVILCRNATEPLKQLGPQEKVEFMRTEKLRLNSLGIPNYYSQRREKPLKIYLDSK